MSETARHDGSEGNPESSKIDAHLREFNEALENGFEPPLDIDLEPWKKYPEQWPSTPEVSTSKDSTDSAPVNEHDHPNA